MKSSRSQSRLRLSKGPGSRMMEVMRKEALVGDARTYDGKRVHPPAPIMARIQPILDAMEAAETKVRKRAAGKR